MLTAGVVGPSFWKKSHSVSNLNFKNIVPEFISCIVVNLLHHRIEPIILVALKAHHTPNVMTRDSTSCFGLSVTGICNLNIYVTV